MYRHTDENTDARTIPHFVQYVLRQCARELQPVREHESPYPSGKQGRFWSQCQLQFYPRTVWGGNGWISFTARERTKSNHF